MLDQFRRVIAPPVFDDDRQNRLAELLNAFLLVAAGLSILGVLVIPFVVRELVLPFMAVLGGSALIYLYCLYLLHHFHLRAASLVFIAVYWVFQNLSVAINGGMNSPSILNYSTGILIAGFLLELRASIGLALLTIVLGAGYIYADAIGALPPPANPVSQSLGWVTLAFNLIGLAVIQHWATRSLNRALGRARQSEHVSAERNRELEHEIAERKRTEDALRESEQNTGHFQEYLKRLHMISIELSRKESLDDFFRMVVESGRNQLGFDRTGLWLFDQDARTEIGTFGTDRNGQTIDERNLRFPVNEFSDFEVILSGKQQFVLHDPIKIVTFSGDELAEGWILQAALWDGERVIGYISTDNALRHQPVQLYQKELLSVFGSMVGNLYTRKRSEIALRESEERYRRISELVSDYAFSFHVNADGTQTVDWLIGSPIQLTGYDNAELTRARGAYHPEEEERVRGDLERTLQGSPTEGDYRIITKDGDVRWIRVRRQPVWDAKENRVTRFYGAVQDVTQRRQAGDLLRQSEERYRTLFDQSRDGIFISSRNGSILDANQAIVDLTGYTRDELAVLEAVDLYVNPEDRFAFQQDIEQHGSVTDYEVTLKRKDGTLRTCLVSATVRRSQNGTILGYQGSTRDITAQKRAQEALRLNEEIRRQFLEKLRTLHDVEIQLSKTESFDELCRQAVEFGRNRLGFDRFSVWFVDSDPEYMVGSFGTSEHGIVRDERNQRVKITFGADMTEILDGRVLISTGDDSPVFDDQLRVVGQGWKAAAKLWVADRTIGWLFTDNLFRHEPVSDYQLELLALYAATIGHLATAKRTLENLLYSESRLRQAMRLARLGMWEWDIASDKTTWSEEMFEMYGITAEQFTGKGEDYFSFTHEDDRETQRDNIRRAFERTATASSADANKFEPDPKEFRIVRPDGTICYTRGDAVAIVDNEGRPVQMFGILMDITERKFAENQALELALTREREQNLKNFIDTLSHDLKTPLTVIKTGLYLLERIPDPESQSDKIALISRQVTLLEKYIMDLLTISRLDHLPELTHQAVNLNDLVEDIASRLRTTIEQKSLAITLDLAQTPATVFGDADQLDRMLVNLIENAVSYTPSNGSISVRTNVEEQHVVVQIIDSGIGINDTELPRIFDRFYRSAEAQEVSKFGSGLGLAIVKRILDLHAGDIEVQSRVGQGTMFRVWMPIGVPTPFHQKSDHTRSS